ncbi:MAG: hypothetical protein LBV02_01990 [Bacteroidales bacterium]|jgi:hypothetical protein|nr:hypothetical protein [Bacteroidales bacterium]
MRKDILSILFFVFISLSLSAQTALGTFKDYLPYHMFKDVAIGKDVVYAATYTSLMLVDKSNASALSTWSKVDGLSEVGISCIEYSDEADALIIAYTNSNIDIIKNQKLTNISDIKNKQMSGAKTINDIITYGKKAYVSCAFGIVVLNLETLLVDDTWFTTRNSENFLALTTVRFGNDMYISTSRGIFHTPINSYQIADFSTWTKVEEMGNEEYKMLHPFKNKLFAVKKDARVDQSPTPQDSLFIYENGSWRRDYSLPIYRYASFDSQGDELLICDFFCFYVLDEELNTIQSGDWNDHLSYPQRAVLDGNEIWIADDYVGLIRYFRNQHYADFLFCEGPFKEMTESIDYVGGVLALVPGTKVGWGISYYPASVSWMKNGKWGYNWNGYNAFEDVRDFNKIAINPQNPREFYVASWSGGLFKFVDGVAVAQYNYANAPFELTLINNVDSANLISAIGFDDSGNLWISNSQDSRPLKKMDTQGHFTAYSLSPYVNATLGTMAEHLLYDSRGQVWVTYPRSGTYPIVVFKEGTNGNANKVAHIEMNYSAEISTTTVTAIAEDNNGEIWIGTEQGIKVVYNPGNVFNSQVHAQNILITQSGFTHPLLESEQVTCIAVDGGNRKWIGTAKAGIFLMSSDGTEELLHLTSENSPLFSNQITAIEINSDNGEVYIGTAAGLISYKGYATGGREDYSEVLVYPNPVKDGYEGDIAVNGLMDNSFCKIADAAGNLVCHGYAYGGQFIWSGKDYKGNKVATGVYFVFASDQTGKEKSVAKILIIR